VADIVLPVRELATRLVELAQNKESLALLETLRETDKILLARILGLLHTRTGHDFSKYKQATVLRRLSRRIALRTSAIISLSCKTMPRKSRRCSMTY
jgi:two-component system CheB/CheR fusion protein